MTIKRKTAKQAPATKRNKYSIETKEKARKYYLMGLNLQEISKLLDGCPVRTLDKWQIEFKWTELKNAQNIKIRTLELYEAGKKAKEIAETLKISRATVFRYIKVLKQNKEP